ncbi:MAG: methyltransferase domain-containing protein [Planctomycetes bacterium]|nr:methyltransferase domain-containing protein [Planctomycetota bacterium]
MSDSRTATCPICRAGSPLRALEQEGAPANCVQLWPTAEQARAVPRGTLRIECCTSCGHLWNSAFDASRVIYTPEYDASLHFSPRFQRYVEELVERLVAELPLRDRRLLEIGCGKGEFLDLLCRRGGCRGVGFDTSFSGAIPADAAWTVERRAFSAAEPGLTADLVASRQVLEHVEDPLAFVLALRATLEQSALGALFLELPNGEWILRDLGIWDVIYEHVSIFTPLSLRALLQRADLDIRWLESAFEGQYLRALALRGERERTAPSPSALAEQLALVERFGATYRAKVEEWGRRLEALARAGRRVALWGAGAKGTTFLSLVKPLEALRHVIDIHPRKVGRHVPLTGHRVDPPEALRDSGVDVILVMNPAYAAEIGASARELGLQAELLVV